jgi:uncharacterized peroxidase-related enzyme
VAYIETDPAGDVANYERVFAHRPEIYAAWRQLVGAITGTMDLRRYELATLAAARRLRSRYCSLAHGRVLATQFYEPAEVRRIALGHHDADLDDVDVAVMDFAEKVAADASAITRGDVDRLRDVGLSDGEIVDVAAAAAARAFFSKMVDALGAEPDASLEQLEPGLRDALTRFR